MPLPRYEREREKVAGLRFTRAVIRLYLFAALIGLIIGLAWVVAGLLHFHPLW
jgi:hypothetical protein